MQLGPACYSVGGSRSLSVSGRFNPWQNNLVMARQQAVLDAQPDRRVQTDMEGGRRLFTMEPLAQTYWMNVDVFPEGSLLFLAGDPVPTESQIAGGVKYTVAQLRVTWTEAPSRQRTLDVDIGAGVSLTFPPTNQLSMDLLVPNPEFQQTRPDQDNKTSVRPPFDSTAFNFASTITAKATCVYSPGVTRARLTRRIYLDGITGGTRDAREIELPRGARTVLIEGAPGVASAPLVPGDIVAWMTTAFVPPVGPPVPAPGFPQTDIEFAGLTTAISQVPNNANILHLEIPAGKSADLAIITELDVG